MYKDFIQPVLSYAFPEWFSFLYDTLKKSLEVYHRSVCRVISSCLTSTPIPLLLLESLTPSTGNHVESPSTHLLWMGPSPPCRQFLLQHLASNPMQPRLKKKPSWQSFCSSQENQVPRETLILYPPPAPKLHCDLFHWRLLSLHNSGRHDAATDFLRRLPASDVVVWTDDFVTSSLGAGDTGLQTACWRCLFSSSLLYSAGLIFSSFSAESLALVHGLEWCHTHRKKCYF